ncbi:MAG: fructosamine kinase family protein [Gammaproteobacteria bacterium]|nr:fructosamine kinase family protein [Gammaproteobacteria bacterium]
MVSSGNLQPVEAWLRANLSSEIDRFEPVGGGCINDTGVVWQTTGERLFLKQHPDAPEDFFHAEACGLEALRAATSLRIPRVIHADSDFLLLEDLGNGSPVGNFWQLLGTGLAQLHSKTHRTFGLEQDNYCGRTPQRNTPSPDGFAFFASNRLNILAEQANGAGLMDSSDVRRVNRLAANLHEHIPAQPAVLIHGDLWSGNVHCDNEGVPALIDPACYRGWAEAELAMTVLFGGFQAEFYRAYEDASNIDRDWRERAPIYNLYHLLNHLVLFGTGYLGQVKNVLARYT